MTILDTIVKAKQITLNTLDDIINITPQRHAPIPFKEKIIADNKMGIISEIKRASPSKGNINLQVDILEQAKAYYEGGASAISVLTESDFFKGSMDDLIKVRQIVDIPILNKDFIIDKRQITLAYNAGADIILLIVAILDDQTLQSFYDYAYSLGLEVIVEVHNEEEMKRALKLNPEIIGINNRNLKLFKVDIAQTETLLEDYYQDSILFISESGIHTKNDALRMKQAGAKALLIGESLMTNHNPKDAIQTFRV